MNYIIISDDSYYSNQIIKIVSNNLNENDCLNIVDDTYQVANLDAKNNLVINTVYSEHSKNLCLQIEDLNITTIDFTNMFVDDTTIPLISDETDDINSNSLIYRVPNEYVLYLLDPLKKLLDEYKVKRIATFIYENKKVDKYLDNIISADLSTLLDYSDLMTTSFLDFTDSSFIHVFFEFYRPFNINTVIENINGPNILRIDRDLSVNSGLNIWLSHDIRINEQKIISIIKKVKKHII